jgi:hypothetical protein
MKTGIDSGRWRSENRNLSPSPKSTPLHGADDGSNIEDDGRVLSDLDTRAGTWPGLYIVKIHFFREGERFAIHGKQFVSIVYLRVCCLVGTIPSLPFGFWISGPILKGAVVLVESKKQMVQHA